MPPAIPLAFLLLALAWWPGGSLVLTKSPAPAKPPVVSQKAGIVFVVEGVGGFDVFGTSARWALPRAGVRHEIRDFVWTHGWGHVLKDLQDAQHMVRKAGDLAQEIRAVKALAPERPVYVVAKSGGTGVALVAAEQLPPGTLERMILLSSAVSPTYDLRPALRATKYEIVSFHSPYDQVVLGWGTRQFGTIDRVRGPSAGLHGFVIPANLSAADRALYDRLVQVRWHASMLLEGHTGAHSGTSMPAFMTKEVAPWLKP
jgi:pimeloyl-ACP methyl ester carboxylesterase